MDPARADAAEEARVVPLLRDELDTQRSAPLVLELASSAESARLAREELCALLGDAGERGETACLLLTELVSNAVRHAGGPLSVRAGVRSDLLLVEVRDGSDRMPVLVKEQDPDAEGGRGILLLDRLADRWGAEPLPTGKRVWFELSLR